MTFMYKISQDTRYLNNIFMKQYKIYTPYEKYHVYIKYDYLYAGYLTHMHPCKNSLDIKFGSYTRSDLETLWLDYI